MDATCAIQASIHVFSLVRKYVSRILGTYHIDSSGILPGAVFSDILKIPEEFPKSVFLRKKYGKV